MRLVTFTSENEAPKVGVVVDERVFSVDASAFPELNSFLAAGHRSCPRRRHWRMEKRGSGVISARGGQALSPGESAR